MFEFSNEFYTPKFVTCSNLRRKWEQTNKQHDDEHDDTRGHEEINLNFSSSLASPAKTNIQVAKHLASDVITWMYSCLKCAKGERLQQRII